MAETFEQSLRRAMEALGRIVEKLIGKAKQARVQVESRGGVQPLLSLESQLTPARVRELVEAATQRVIANVMPELTEQATLEVGEGPPLYGPRMLGQKAQTAIGVEISGAESSVQGDPSRGFVLRAQPARLPFAGNRFAYILGRLATAAQGDMVRVVHELGRVLAPGGQGVIVDYHPYGLYAKRGIHRLRPAESTIRKIEDYYRLCKLAGVRVVDLKEALIEDDMRPLFKEDEIGAYRALKGTPFLVFIFIYKPKQR